MRNNIAAIVVTYNRLEILKENITSLRNQSSPLSEILVINNSSTDGTEEWLKQQRDITVITQENTGSSGGQYTGIRFLFEKGYQYIWCLDCDVVPSENALEELIKSPAFENKKTAFLTSYITDIKNNISYINVPYLGTVYEIIEGFEKFNALKIKSASFGSLLIKREVIEIIGFPIKEYFIWGDDVEYTFRMIENGYEGFMVFTSRAIHFQPVNERNPFKELKYNEKKTFYAIRNSVSAIKLRRKALNHSRLRVLYSLFKFYIEINKSIFRNSKPVSEFIFRTLYFWNGLMFNPREKRI